MRNCVKSTIPKEHVEYGKVLDPIYVAQRIFYVLIFNVDYSINENDNIKEISQQVVAHSQCWLTTPLSMTKPLENPKVVDEKQGGTSTNVTVKREHDKPSSNTPTTKKKDKGDLDREEKERNRAN